MQNNKSIFRSTRFKQAGFTLLELTTVIAIIAILAIVSLVALPPFIISGKVGPAATELTRGMQSMRVNTEGSGPTPYAAANTAMLANLMRNGSIFSATGTGGAATLSSSLRLVSQSQVTVAPGTLTSTGDSYIISMSNVSDAACPSLAAAAQKASEIVTINGTVVKAAGANYNGATAASACTLFDTNTFTFQSM